MDTVQLKPDPTPIENAYAIALSLRAALCELAANDERSAEQVRERLCEIVPAVDGLGELLRTLITPEGA